MKNQNVFKIILILLCIISYSVKSQCYILFEPKVIETANDSYSYNALTGMTAGV